MNPPVDLIAKALRVIDGDVVVLESERRLTNEEYRRLREDFAELVRRRPELSRVSFLFFERGEFDVSKLTADQRGRLLEELSLRDTPAGGT